MVEKVGWESSQSKYGGIPHGTRNSIGLLQKPWPWAKTSLTQKTRDVKRYVGLIYIFWLKLLLRSTYKFHTPPFFLFTVKHGARVFKIKAAVFPNCSVLSLTYAFASAARGAYAVESIYTCASACPCYSAVTRPGSHLAVFVMGRWRVLQMHILSDFFDQSLSTWFVLRVQEMCGVVEEEAANA